MADAQNLDEVQKNRSPEMRKQLACQNTIQLTMPNATRAEKLEALKACVGSDDIFEEESLFL